MGRRLVRQCNIAIAPATAEPCLGTVLVIDVSDREANHVGRELFNSLPDVDLAVGVSAQRQGTHIVPGIFHRTSHAG